MTGTTSGPAWRQPRPAQDPDGRRPDRPGHGTVTTTASVARAASPPDIEALVTPSIDSATMTFAAMRRAADLIGDDCRVVADTLETVGDALSALTESEGSTAGLAGVSLVGLPMIAAARAAKMVAAQYVRQQTGVPLDNWVELVTNAAAQFETYLAQLGTVSQIGRRYNSVDHVDLDPTHIQEDLDVLQRTQWQTQAWKQILERIAKLGTLVDAILQADLPDEAEPTDLAAAPRTAGLSASLHKRIKDVQARTTDRTGDLRQWVLQPFVEVRDKVRALPAQTQRLAAEVVTLEVLLDLEIATIRACSGEISPEARRVIGVRVAANVILPDLATRLAEAKSNAAKYESYLIRLDESRAHGVVNERVREVLNTEYRNALVHYRAELDTLEGHATLWRAHGPTVLAAASDWIDVELDVLAARTLVERREPPRERRVLLERERQRLDEATALLASL